VFPSIESALENAKSGDWIYLQQGHYPREVVITKCVNLFGYFREKRTENGEIEVLHSVFEKPVVWRVEDESEVGSISNVYFDAEYEDDGLIVESGKVWVKGSIFHHTDSGTGVRIDGGWVKLWGCWVC